MEFRRLEHFSASGWDEAQFIISTNPGQPMRPLKDVASGGELSRIMLAINTLLADSDDIPTLIFDEIDTGISGRTAQKAVSYTHLDVYKRPIWALWTAIISRPCARSLRRRRNWTLQSWSM